MNIAMVSEHASPLAVLGGVDAGGQNVHVAELSAALVRAGHRVTVFTRRDQIALPKCVRMPSGATVQHIAAGPPHPIAKDALLPYMDRFARVLHGELLEGDFDVVHAHFWMSARAALEAAQPLRVPVVTTFHALGSEKRRMQGQADTSPAQRIDEEARIGCTAARVIATSSSEVFELGRLGADARRLRVIPCGVDADFFAGCASDWSHPQAQRHRIVSLCRLVQRKGVDDIISALAHVPDAELVIAGGPPAAQLGSDAEACRLLEHANACGVGDRVAMLGRLDRARAATLLRSADAVVCAAWYEPFGLVALEAMAAGVPVVATAVGGQNDTVIDGFTGFLVAPHSPGAIAFALRRLFADPDLGARMGACGRARARERFTWDRIAADTARVYAQLQPAYAARAYA